MEDASDVCWMLATWQMAETSAADSFSGRCTKSSRSISSLRFILAVHTWKMRRF